MPNDGQHLPWWGLAGHLTVRNLGESYAMVSGSTTRSLAVLVAAAAAWYFLRRPTPERIVFVAALAMYARGFFEVEYWPYYVAPAAVFLALLGARTTEGNSKRLATLVLSATMLYLSTGPSFVGILGSPWRAMAVLTASGFLALGSAAPKDLLEPGLRPYDLRKEVLIPSVRLAAVDLPDPSQAG